MKYLSLLFNDIIIYLNHYKIYIELRFDSNQYKYITFTKNKEWIIVFNDCNYILTDKMSAIIKNDIYKKYNGHYHKHKLFNLCRLYNIQHHLLIKQFVSIYLIDDLLKLIINFI
jgi:hypothetical protein